MARSHASFEPELGCPGWLKPDRYRQRGRQRTIAWRCSVCRQRFLRRGNGGGLMPSLSVDRSTQLRLIARNRQEQQQTADTVTDGVTVMRLKLCVHRKAGAPNYGSDGAGAELELELSDDLADKPESLVQVSQIWYAALERAVGLELERMAARRPPAIAAEPVLSPAGQSIPQPPQPPPPPPQPPQPTNPPQNGWQRNGNRSGGQGDPPRSGRQLLGWANGHGCHEHLMALAKAWNCGRVVDWSQDNVQAAYNELVRHQSQGRWGG